MTLEVTPQEAEIIDLARSVGALSLVLRSQVDAASVETIGSRKADLLERTGQLGKQAADAISRAGKTEPVQTVAARPVKRANPVTPTKVTEKLEVIRGMSKSQESAE